MSRWRAAHCRRSKSCCRLVSRGSNHGSAMRLWPIRSRSSRSLPAKLSIKSRLRPASLKPPHPRFPDEHRNQSRSQGNVDGVVRVKRVDIPRQRPCNQGEQHPSRREDPALQVRLQPLHPRHVVSVPSLERRKPPNRKARGLSHVPRDRETTTGCTGCNTRSSSPDSPPGGSGPGSA
jgi:hypothetical protein